MTRECILTAEDLRLPFDASTAAGAPGAEVPRGFHIFWSYAGVFVGSGLLNSEGPCSGPRRSGRTHVASPPVGLGIIVLVMVIAAVFGAEVIVE